jgi:hypothetical protein
MAAVSMALCGVAMADPPTGAPAQTSQAIYDAGQAAYDKGDWDTAITEFTQVLAGAKLAARSEAVIRTRLADSLSNTGRLSEAEAEAAQAVALLGKGAAGPDTDLADAYLAEGDALRLDLSYDEAVDAFRKAQAMAAGPNAAVQSGEASLGIIKSTMVTHPEVAAGMLDAMIADTATFQTQTKLWRAAIYTLRARAELNRSGAEQALPYIQQALALEGGLAGRQIDITQVAVRGDAALIFSKLGRQEKAHTYMAYTGAGHLPDDGWADGAEMEAAVCGPDIAPEDSAVVEFAIADDGRTSAVAPVWSSRPGQTGVEFARAVRGWRWRPDKVAALNSFWRASIRVQLRCATEPPPLSLELPFTQATRAWLLSKGDTEPFNDLGPQSDRGADFGRAPSAELAQITALFRRVGQDIDPAAIAADGAQLDALLVQAGAPVEARALAASASAHGGGRAETRRDWASNRARLLRQALPRFDAIAGAQRSAAWLRVEMAVQLESAGDFAEARPPLEAVAALPDDALAAARLQAAGLTEQKCDLLDVHPVATNLATSGDEFPTAAALWGFEGWVQAGFDIAADGSVKNVRALISYPPFVFSAAAETTAARFRYLPPTLGDTALGCTGQTINMRFIMPQMH